jgi:UDP-N-acetylmuramate--alanine ligase
MSLSDFPASLNGLEVHFTGAKGTGMAALAEIFSARGAILTGSDVPDVFYTDKILARIGMRLFAGFDSSHVGSHIRMLIYSAAYDPAKNPEILEAKHRGLLLFNYPEALGALSRHYDSSGVSGVHGKTTTTAMAGTLLDAFSLPATVLAGSSVASFGDRCTLIRGDKYFVAETCEYRKHFLNFSPSRIVLTSVESDHQDFFPTYESIRDAFIEYGLSLPQNIGKLIYCADDKGAREVARSVIVKRPDIEAIEYGFSAKGKWKISACQMIEGATVFQIGCITVDFMLHVPGRHLVLDAVAALALVSDIYCGHRHIESMPEESFMLAANALKGFRGSKRRSEILGEAGGILFMDDYGHHPTAIKATIDGVKSFWPSRRLIVDFMSHTYTRTIALADDFVASLDGADCVVLHKIYASAREMPDPNFNGFSLCKKVATRRTGLEFIVPDKDFRSDYVPEDFLLYTEEPLSAIDVLSEYLRPGDIFLTMGAGDNWKLGQDLLSHFSKKGYDQA